MVILKRKQGGVKIGTIWDTMLNGQWVHGVAAAAKSPILVWLYEENRRMLGAIKELSAEELRQQPLP